MGQQEDDYARNLKAIRRLYADLAAAAGASGLPFNWEVLADYAMGKESPDLQALAEKLPGSIQGLDMIRLLQTSMREISGAAWREGLIRTEGDIQVALVCHAMAALAAATPTVRLNTGISLLLGAVTTDGIDIKHIEGVLEKGLQTVRDLTTNPKLMN